MELGRTPWSARVPLDPLFANDTKLMRTSKATRASAADLGVRPPSIPKLGNYMALAAAARPYVFAPLLAKTAGHRADGESATERQQAK